jgi:hypothetical protein
VVQRRLSFAGLAMDGVRKPRSALDSVAAMHRATTHIKFFHQGLDASRAFC